MPDVSRDFLAERTARAEAFGYPKAKWVQFCEAMLDQGYTLKMYENGASKYILVFNLGLRFKLRFSNHPGRHRGRVESCDFFVGVNEFGTWTTAQAIDATVAALGPSPFAPKETADA